MDKLPSSIAVLMGDVALKLGALWRVEWAILNVEIIQKRKVFWRAVAWLVCGVALGFSAVAMILYTLVLAMMWLGLSPLTASSTVALVLVLAAASVMRRALTMLRGLNFNLEHIKTEIRKDAEFWSGSSSDVR